MNNIDSRLFVLNLMGRWHSRIIWKVSYWMAGEEECVTFFKSEKNARDWASMLSGASIVAVTATVRSKAPVRSKPFDYLEDTIHTVAGS